MKYEMKKSHVLIGIPICVLIAVAFWLMPTGTDNKKK